MRASSKCPKCGGTKLFVCENMQPERESSNVVHPFAITSVLISKRDTGATEGTARRTDVGSYETWICAGCGFTEWYAKDPEQLLEKLSKLPAGGVRVVNGPGGGPYR